MAERRAKSFRRSERRSPSRGVAKPSRPPRRSARRKGGAAKQTGPLSSFTHGGKDRKRKREREDEAPAGTVGKKARLTPTSLQKASPLAEAARTEIECWTRTGCWPMSSMAHLFAQKKPPAALRRKLSDATSTSSAASSDQKPREQKSTPYQHHGYITLLESKGSFMHKDESGPKAASKTRCQELLDGKQTVPEESPFSPSRFERTFQRAAGSNEAKVIDVLSKLIAPSAEELADSADHLKHLKHLKESVNDGWTNSIPVTTPRPQPDRAVGFEWRAFPEDLRARLQPFVGEPWAGDLSYFMVTHYMLFPFLSVEVKCGSQGLTTADKQNAHSATIAVRAVVELFKLIRREKEIDREILAFSVSHDERIVAIFGHYPVINGDKTEFYRYPIRTFGFTERDGGERWAAYRFVRNVYEKWMPGHFNRLCSAISEIPLDFDVPPSSENTGLFQRFDEQSLSQSQDGSQADPEPQNATPVPSFSEMPPPKRAKKKKKGA